MYEVRITRSEFDLEKVFESCLFFREGNGVEVKFHLQGIVYDSVGMATIRARLRKLGLKGNEDYKCACVKDEEKYLAYIAKDQDLYYNSTDIDPTQYYGKYVKTTTSKSRFEKIFESCDSIHPKTVVSHVLDYYIKNDLTVNSRLIQGYVTTYLCKYDTHFREKLTDTITENLLK